MGLLPSPFTEGGGNMVQTRHPPSPCSHTDLCVSALSHTGAHTFAHVPGRLSESTSTVLELRGQQAKCTLDSKRSQTITRGQCAAEAQRALHSTPMPEGPPPQKARSQLGGDMESCMGTEGSEHFDKEKVKRSPGCGMGKEAAAGVRCKGGSPTWGGSSGQGRRVRERSGGTG